MRKEENKEREKKRSEGEAGSLVPRLLEREPALGTIDATSGMGGERKLPSNRVRQK